MDDAPVYIVVLRRPKRSNRDEKRSDPFYEFGSFGCTGCHRHTLMNPKYIERLDGARLAFAQGGREGFRLVFLTPPITTRAFEDRVEARWSPKAMPFRYSQAPVLASNKCHGQFPSIKRIAQSTGRSTTEGGFASRFRDRATPLDDATARQLVRIYEKKRMSAGSASTARSYDEALPYRPNLTDRHRRASYRNLLRELKRGATPVKRKPAPKSSAQCSSPKCG